MYIKRLLFICIMLCLCLSLSAQTNGKGMDYKRLSQTFTRSKEKNEIWSSTKMCLDKLNAIIADTAKYNAVKQNRINSGMERLKQAKGHRERFNALMNLQHEYALVNFHKSLAYAMDAKVEAYKVGDVSIAVEATLAETALLVKGGFFREADKAIGTINGALLQGEALLRYYELMFDIEFENGFVSPYGRRPDGIHSVKMMSIYNKVKQEFPDSTYQLTRMLMEYNFHLCRYQEASRYALQLVPQCQKGTEEYAYQLGNAGFTLMGAGNLADAARYMALSAEEQIRLGSIEYPVMRKLAELMTVIGHNEEAYRYSVIAMHNAKQYGSMYRVYEVSQFYPTIHDNMYQTIKRQHDVLIAIAFILAVAVIALCVCFVVIRRKNNSLHLRNHTIAHINAQLNEANDIKIAVFGNVISDSAARRQRDAEFFKNVSRRLAVGDYQDAKDMILKRQNSGKKEYEMIDRIILSIFPQFVEQFYGLLRADSRPANIEANRLTPEMRVFALIRLGISSNNELMSSLNYSLNTIKHYKTVVFNSTDYTNEEFYQHLKDIHYLKRD